MRLLRNLLIGVVVLVVVVIGVGFLLPTTAHVERSIVIDARPATVFTVLNGFRQFEHWNPWAEYDPEMQVAFEGPATGVGAAYSWTGNDQVGTGRQEILESKPWSQVRMRLEFDGFEGDFFSTYDISPEGLGTKVVWGYDGDYSSSIIARYFGLLMDGMLGPDYERGLAKLKAYAESLPKADFSSLRVEEVTAQAQPFVFISSRSVPEPRALGVALGVAYGTVSGHLSAIGVQPAGPPIAVYHGEKDGLVHFDAGLPVGDSIIEDDGQIRVAYTPAGKALRAMHTGSYSGLQATNQQVRAYMAAAGLEPNGPYWEQYLDEFTDVPEAERTTHIYYGVK